MDKDKEFLEIREMFTKHCELNKLEGPLILAFLATAFIEYMVLEDRTDEFVDGICESIKQRYRYMKSVMRKAV